MSLISISNISHSFGDNIIFKNVNFAIERNSQIGLVGKNGSGKTTLFNIITRKLFPENGEVHIAKNTRIVYLTQEPELNDNQTLYECVLESRQDYIELSAKLEAAEQDLFHDHSQESLKRYSKLQQKFEQIDGYTFRTEMKLVLTGLKFPQSVWEQKVEQFSGGEKTRIQLAKFLLQSFDVILLDEPTNHLDMEMIYWLEAYLKKIEKPYVIISHDRHFLDKTVTKIIEIKDHSFHRYSGNYTFYKEESKSRTILQEKEFKKQQKKLKQMDNQIKQFRIWGKARDSEVMYRRAKELEKRLDKIEQIEKPQHERSVNLNIQPTRRSGNDVYILENITFGFPENILASNVNLRMNYQDRIAVLGKNGCGKTTLLRMLNEEIEPMKGNAKKGASLHIGYYDQMHFVLDNTLNVKETIWQLAPLETKGYVFSYLAKYGFTGDDLEKQVSMLSGGEKARLYLAKLIHEKPNFLILDEPTNHLDLSMIASLEEALQNYEGTIIFVSHDTYFIEKIAGKKWFFQNGTITETEDSVEMLFSFDQEKIVKPKKQKPRSKIRKVNPIMLEKLYQEIVSIQKQIELHNEEIISCEEEFHDLSTYKNQEKVKTLTKKIKRLKSEIVEMKLKLEKLDHEYLELSMLQELQ
ncbi:MAG: ATP-binding cassette domain-containing protein [Candidatus Cloacimonetes bacterium]|nr:ATP-binding cassette domain-containing protein [Candidatus Cloacimonadota bacterium]